MTLPFYTFRSEIFSKKVPTLVVLQMSMTLISTILITILNLLLMGGTAEVKLHALKMHQKKFSLVI